MKKKILIFLGAALVAFFGFQFFLQEDKFLSVLVFSKTEGFRHTSIEAGKAALLEMGETHGIRIDTTEDASLFNEKNLSNYNVVVWLNTTGDVLNDAQQLEFNRFIQAGGGYVGIHAAADTEYDWPWYGDLVGAYFKNHPNDPNVREAATDKVDSNHVCVAHLPDRWTRMDEWYNYKDIRSHINVLLNLDESSYEGGENGENHPIAWYHEFDGGRSFYTGMGHTDETFSEEPFLEMIWQGINWVAAEMKPVDFNRSTVAPEENRFQKVVLADNLDEPMELEMLPDGRLIFVERHGVVKIYDPKKETLQRVNTIPVFSKLEDGLLGMALDPNFEKNNWIYCYYSPPGVNYNLLSRFNFTGDSLDLSSEKKVLEVATQRDTCCHSGGSIEFGPNGELFLSTGDNTSPFDSDGFAPIDERKGRKYFDAQRTSANTNDLRGKILRILPEDDGTYSIPDGNLFPKDGSKGRPEIYIMGCRNPWRIHVDKHTGHLYWGDIGPDAGEDSLKIGPKGHDEVNMAKVAGNYGWPYFVGNNKAYHDRDFETGTSSDVAFDPSKPQNTSPNNTGAKELPPTNPAYIWYPYGESKEFPLTEDGGRNAMAGPVYYYDDFDDNPGKFPQYYDKKFFAYDWMRGWIMAVTQTEDGDLERMERFLPSIEWSNPTDIIFSPQGDMYLLEYGTVWFSQNEDARLVHLKYISGNRPPVAEIQADKTVGAAPLSINFSAENSKDYDGDEISLTWSVDGKEINSNDKILVHTFETAGVYTVSLKVEDNSGEVAESKKEIIVGNEPPQLVWNIEGNQSFYFPKQNIKYEVSVNDKEDGNLEKGIDPSRVAISIDYLETGFDKTQIAQGHRAAEEASQFAVGKDLIAKSDCRVCHAEDKKVAGPSYQEVAERYKNDASIVPTLAQRIIKGSNGIWGEQLMSAHPQLGQSEAELMIKYILSLSEEAQVGKGLATSGFYIFDQHEVGNNSGAYVLNASYTDNGADGAKSLTAREMLVIRSPYIAAIDYDDNDGTARFDIEAGQYPGIEEDMSLIIGDPDGYLVFKSIDLTGITGIEAMITAMSAYMDGGEIEIRLDAFDGESIGSIPAETTIAPSQNPVQASITPSVGKHDVYFVYKSAAKGSQKMVCAVIYFKFLNTVVN